MPPEDSTSLTIRALQLRDLEQLEQIGGPDCAWLRRWYPPLRLLDSLKTSYRPALDCQVAECQGELLGLIQAAPVNRARSTWKVLSIWTQPVRAGQGVPSPQEVGLQLLRHCLASIWEARTWMAEVVVSEADRLALYRQAGFQPLAQLTDWAIAPEQLRELAQREAALPNLHPISNADAALLYQLDTVAMPPLMRQVYDRHVEDFRISSLQRLAGGLRQWMDPSRGSTSSAYVFEPQRKAAIGYYRLHLPADRPEAIATLTVHPAYTWLYPELLAKLAQLLADSPDRTLRLSSSDYQPEREECFRQVGAEPLQERLLMSRSVWHKVRESRAMSLEGLQLSGMLQGLAPNRAPVPGSNITWETRRISDPGQRS
jgi:hypothetical protein